MSFAEAIERIPYTSTNQNATGVFAPIMRASGHILYACAAQADEGYTVTPEEIQNELQHASSHLVTTAVSAESSPLSSTAKTYISAFYDATQTAAEEYPDWPETERIQNLRSLADRAASIAAFFDNEYAGIRDSNPGTTL